MASLKDWLPFRFSRKEQKEKALPAQQREARTAGLPAAWADDPFFGPAFQMMRQMDAWMDRFFGGQATTQGFFGDFSRPFVPTVDVSEDAESFKVVAEMPGVKPEDLTLEVQDGSLVLAGEKRHEAEHERDGFYRVERSFGSFHRVIPLPDGLDLDHIDARSKDGVLTIRIPKKEATGVGPRKIEVRA